MAQTAVEYLENGFTKTVLIASRRRVPGCERSDLLQEAALRLLEAPGKFETSRLEERASNAMRTMQRRAFRVASAEVPLESGGVLNTPGPANTSEAIQAARCNALRLAFSSLTAQQRRLIRMLYQRDLLSIEAAARIGVSPSQITKLHQAAIAGMREVLVSKGLMSLKHIEETACF